MANSNGNKKSASFSESLKVVLNMKDKQDTPKEKSFSESLKVVFDKEGIGGTFNEMNKSMKAALTVDKPKRKTAAVPKLLKNDAESPITLVKAPTKTTSTKIKVTPAKTKSAEDHPYLKNVADHHTFKLKSDELNHLAEVTKVEQLYEELKGAPDEAIVFHMDNKNDFASWIKDCVGDWWLGSKVDKVKLEGNPSATRSELVQTLGERIYKLKNY